MSCICKMALSISSMLQKTPIMMVHGVMLVILSVVTKPKMYCLIKYGIMPNTGCSVLKLAVNTSLSERFLLNPPGIR